VSLLSLNYGDVFIGSDSSLSVTITNTGTADLDVSSIALGVGTSSDFAITSGPADIVLVPGANTTVVVTYSPSDVGVDSGTLVIESDDSDEPTVTVSLSGNGVTVAVPEIDVVPLSLNYGDVFIGADSSLTVTITNTGSADLEVTGIDLGAGSSPEFTITSGPALPANIIPGDNVIVEVTYSPSDENDDSGTLVIESSDADEPEVTVSLIGSGVIVAEIEVTIDIKPGSDPNSINLKNKGVIPVAILTTDTFDATTVDPLSVEFGPDGATEAHGRGHIEDVDGDEDLDLLLHFKTQETGIACGDSATFLTGETFDGQRIVGSDSISTVNCK
jgi:hypothetical protein